MPKDTRSPLMRSIRFFLEQSLVQHAITWVRFRNGEGDLQLRQGLSSGTRNRVKSLLADDLSRGNYHAGRRIDHHHKCWYQCFSLSLPGLSAHCLLEAFQEPLSVVFQALKYTASRGANRCTLGSPSLVNLFVARSKPSVCFCTCNFALSLDYEIEHPCVCRVNPHTALRPDVPHQ